MRHILSLFPPHCLNCGWADDARIDVPRKRYLQFFIAYVLSFSFTLIFSAYCLESSRPITLRLVPSVRLLIQAMTLLYFRKPKDPFVKIGNWTH